MFYPLEFDDDGHLWNLSGVGAFMLHQHMVSSVKKNIKKKQQQKQVVLVQCKCS
jgi:hypothetical protein